MEKQLSILEQEMLSTLYEMNRIPIWIFSTVTNTISTYYYSYTAYQEQLCAHISALIHNEQQLHPVKSFNIVSFLNEVYAYFVSTDLSIIVCGPIRLQEEAQPKDYSFSHALNTSQVNELVQTIPVMSIHTFCTAVRLIMLTINKQALSIEAVESMHITRLTDTLEQLITSELFDNMEVIRSHTPYSQEVIVLECIRDGDLDRLIATYRALPKTQYGLMSKNPIKQGLYGSIANITLITRYAIEGGLEEETAYTLSDVYIKKIEQCQYLYEIELLNEKMAIDFTTRVHQSKANKRNLYSAIISSCFDYIQRHLHEKITLNDMANYVHLTPKYLSWLFKQETQKNIIQVIESSKIEEAKRLLLYTDYSTSFISDALAFNSQSYFTAVFKKNVQLTPNRYRLMHKKPHLR